MERAFLIGLIFAFLGTIAAGISGIVMHEYFHGPFMFVTSDPPAADPLRDRHVALGWIATYGVMGLIGGLVTAIGTKKKRFIILALIPVLIIVLLRLIRNSSYLMTEEGRYGIPSAVAFAIIGSILALSIASHFRTSSNQSRLFDPSC